jgi:phenylacetate-CoA ligase
MMTENHWEKEIELMPREELSAWQLKRLNAAVKQAVQAPFYRKTLAEQGCARELKSLADVRSLPFTNKQDLRNHFPYGFLTVDLSKVVRLHSSSGTTGNPTVVFHTAEDIKSWRNMLARCMYMAGARKTDVFQNMMGYGLFTGGLGFHYGAEELGMMTIPAGPGNSKRQIWFMQQFRTTVIHILPSYALRLAGLMTEMGINPQQDLALRVAFIGAEPHSEEVRRKIEESLGVKAFNSYGLSEMCGPGVAFECEYQDGLHLWEDQFYP